MPTTDNIYWTTDEAVFLKLEGAKELVDWFGFVPSFHDATLEALELGSTTARLKLKAFRMTNEVDPKGFYILDRHAFVIIQMSGLSGVALRGEPSSIISGLGVRRVSARPTNWESGVGPALGDFEVGWDSSWGLEGTLYARDVRFELEPTEA